MENELDKNEILNAYYSGTLKKTEAQALLQKIGEDPWLKSRSKQARIVTLGTNKTTPGLQRRPNGLKIPVDIKGRHYRDIKKADLTEIEAEYDRQSKIAKELSQDAKAKIYTKKKEDEEKAFKLEVEKRMAENSSKEDKQ